jgi:tetratricopeptide (TPR) repeat protein
MAEKMLLAFGRYLKLVRERRKLSLEDVSTLTKSYPEPINKGYLSRVERGLARVGFSKMVALARAYEVPLDAFGEKLALDLEVDQLRDAPDTRGKTFGELTEEARGFIQRGLRWHCYACMRDALPRAATDPLSATYRNPREQTTAAVLSHGVAAGGLGRYVLALTEFECVHDERDALSDENLPIVYQQSATAKRRLGFLDEARVLATKAVELSEQSPTRRHLGDALEVHAHLAGQAGDYKAAIMFAQRAFAAYKAVGGRLDCARTLNNLAQFYFDVRRYKAARRALSAADRLARELQADSIRARVRILLGEIESIEAHHDKASALWHEAVDIARRTHDSVVHFKAEFQLFKLAIAQDNATIVNALGRRLDRMTPWISRSEPEVSEFRQLYAIHRKPKQRSVAARQLARPVTRNPG